jgi:DNA-binding transcriptional LysR family regulator|tara:strand:- start:2645 stop:3517 length:873 start_codon:yes stop_codon:yes gene_type:complete
MRITFKQLSVFNAVAKTSSVSKAADSIALSQSATSMSLAELENHLGAPLFHRHGKRLQLNDYGRWLQPKVHQLLQQALEIEHSANSAFLQGHLKISASSTIGNYLVPAMIGEFAKTHPQVEIDLSVGNTEQVIDDMLHLRADIGLIEGPCHTQQLSCQPWRTDSLKVFSRPDHPLADKKKVSANMMTDESWILRESGSGTREIFSLACQGIMSNLKVKLELGNSEAIKQAVKTGLGLGCLSELALASEIKHKELRVLNTPELKLTRELSIVQTRNIHQSVLLKEFKLHIG